MSTESGASPDRIFEEAVNQYSVRCSQKFERLESCKEGIARLRAKGVSYREITRILNESGITVSRFTVARYCRAAIDGRKRSAKKKMSLPALPPEKPAPPPAPPSVINPSSDTAFRPKRRGPRIADPRNI